MGFVQYGALEKFPRDEHVDIHVREITLGADAPTAQKVEFVEIREFIKSGEVYGHGLLIPKRELRDLKVALERLGA